MIFLLTAFSTAKLGDLIGISSAPSPAGTRAITAVTVDPATGVPSKLVGLNASWGYFSDSSATADHANSLYYVMLAPSVATSVLVKIDVTKGAVVDQKTYDMPFGLLTYDYEKAELYASESNGFDGDCVYRIDPATLEATELACLPDGWVGFENGLAVDQAEEVVYLMAANMVNASIDHSTVFGIDRRSGKIVTEATHKYGLSVPEIVFSLYYDSDRLGAIVGMCSDVHACASTPGCKGYYLCSQDLTGPTVKVRPLGNPRIFGDGAPKGYKDAYPSINGIGTPTRSYYCGFALTPSEAAAAAGAAPAAWLYTIDLDDGSVRSTANRSFPTNLVDLAFVSAPPGAAAVPAPAIAAAAEPPRAEKRLRSRPRMGLDNRPILPSL